MGRTGGKLRTNKMYSVLSFASWPFEKTHHRCLQRAHQVSRKSETQTQTRSTFSIMLETDSCETDFKIKDFFIWSWGVRRKGKPKPKARTLQVSKNQKWHPRRLKASNSAETSRTLVMVDSNKISYQTTQFKKRKERIDQNHNIVSLCRRKPSPVVCQTKLAQARSWKSCSNAR